MSTMKVKNKEIGEVICIKTSRFNPELHNTNTKGRPKKKSKEEENAES